MREDLHWVRELFRRNRTAVLVSLALSVVAAVVEAVSVALYYPVLALFVGTPPAQGPGAQVIDGMRAVVGDRPGLVTLLGALVGLVVIRAACLYVARVVSNHYELEFNLRLKRTMLERLTAAAWDFVIRSKSGVLLNVFSQYTTAASRGLFYLVGFVIDLVSCLAYVALALYTSPPLALFIAVTGLVVAPVLRRSYWQIRALVQRNLDVQDRLANQFLEYLRGLKTFKSMSLERPYLREIDRDLVSYTSTERQSYRLQAALALVGEPLFAVVVAVFLLVAFYAFAVSMETLVIFFALLARTYSRLNSLQMNGGKLVQNAPAMRRCLEFDAEALGHAERPGGRRLDEPITRIEFRDVRFAYPDGTRLFERVSFDLDVRRGLIGIVGPSGAGKSTLLDLLCGLVLPSAGTYRINGVDVADLDLREFRARVGFVPQSPVLFDRSILENISLCDAAETDRERVQTAAKLADADGFIGRLVRGYDTVMGRDGASLSVGQVQRLSIARALYQQPEIVFADEPTSALDARSAADVLDVLAQVADRYPVFLVSHSDRARARAQTLVQVDGGAVTVVHHAALPAAP